MEDGSRDDFITRRQQSRPHGTPVVYADNERATLPLLHLSPPVLRPAPPNTTAFSHTPVQRAGWRRDPPPTVNLPSLTRSQRSALFQVGIPNPPVRTHSGRLSAFCQEGATVDDKISPCVDDGPSTQSPVAFDSIDENLVKIPSPQQPSGSKPNAPTSSPTFTSGPTRADIRRLFQAGSSSPSVALDAASDILPFPSASPPTPAHSTTTFMPKAIAQSDPPPPSQNLRNSFPTFQPRGSVGNLQGHIPSAESRLPVLPQQTSLENRASPDIGVETGPQHKPRVPDGFILAPALGEALNASITSGHFADTKIYLFSRRNSGGDVYEPKALYANSLMLKSVPYFDDLFSGNYSESATRNFDEDVPEKDSVAERYDYSSDSDLEDADDPPEKEDDNAFGNGPQDTIRDGDMCAYHEGKAKEGRVIKIQDVAFVTFQAFLLYLYTGHIEFAPFGSEDNRKSRIAEIAALAPDHIPRPSPKSIYRLADKYDVLALKLLAARNMKEGLEGCDPVQETFSRFASYYPEILKMHVKNLATVLTGDDSGEVQSRLDEKLQAFAEGEIHHASEAFSSLWRILTKGGNSKTPLDTHSNTLSGSSPAKKSFPLIRALIKSIRQGSFCDRRYLAKREGKGKMCSPVYISSAVIEDIELSLNSLVAPEREVYDLDHDSDSDYDSEDTMEETDLVSENPECLLGKESEPTKAALLSTGAFSTWRALFFYLYSMRVQFAPLKSNGLEARAKYVKGNWEPGNPLPCSPKSICYLASKLGLLHLENAALGDATAKTSVTNVVKETFSKSTARLPRLREVQCQLLLSSSKSERIAKSTEEHIHGLADGQVSHRYAALSLGFKMAIEAKRMVSSGAEAPPYLPSAFTQASMEFEDFFQRRGMKSKRRKQQASAIHSVGSGSRTEITTPGTTTTGPILPTRIAPSCPNPGCPQRAGPLRVHGVGGSTLCQGCGWRLW